MKQPRKILIGSNNAHKLKEIQEILDAFEFVTPASLGLDLDIDESGMTFAENAEIKARAFAQASGLPTLADGRRSRRPFSPLFSQAGCNRCGSQGISA